ncbi:MAG: 6-carboxytetrahydropterin synthase [Nitrospirales bacterium]|nr:6-carboxytetrahydropterin synthase [Nitrospira sp.]MDR4501552.1 6-carboxytetrahydropterin synthase [Nitrospirales bacterium]
MSSQLAITRSYYFSAAHRLHTPQLSDEANQKIFGKCNNLNGHGHNYTVFVTVNQKNDSRPHEPLDCASLDRFVTRHIVERFDHQHLNYDPAFDGVVTTGENLAKLIWELLVDELPVGTLQKIGVLETRDNYFEYVGDR